MSIRKIIILRIALKDFIQFDRVKDNVHLLGSGGWLPSLVPSDRDCGQEIGAVMEGDRRQELQELVLDYPRAAHYTAGLLTIINKILLIITSPRR